MQSVSFFSIRRKNGYTLAVFFKYQMFISLFGGILFMVLGIFELASSSGKMTAASSCDVGTSIAVRGTSKNLFTSNVPVASSFLDAAEVKRHAMMCSGDTLQSFAQSICTTSQA